jgi:hypothetical protein
LKNNGLNKPRTNTLSNADGVKSLLSHKFSFLKKTKGGKAFYVLRHITLSNPKCLEIFPFKDSKKAKEPEALKGPLAQLL